MIGVATAPKTDTAAEQKTVDYVLERMAVSERFDRSFKEKALGHFLQLNNILPKNYPYFSRFFEPATATAANDTIEGIMAQVFGKDDNNFDLEPVEDQDEVQTEMMRHLMRFVLREKVKYKILKFYQCQEATFYGNGTEKHLIEPKWQTFRGRSPLVSQDVFNTTIGMVQTTSSTFEVWPKSKIVSRFDCYPAPTGATIQEMPYFIERVIMPLRQLKAMAKWAGYKHTDEIEGFFSLDQTEGQVTGNFSERHFDLYERLEAVGYSVRAGGIDGSSGVDAEKYTEVLIYSQAPDVGEGCSRITMIADRKFLLKDGPNPFDHGLKQYSSIQFSPRAAQVWQAKGVPELVESLQYKLNTRLNQISDIIDLIRSPMTYVGRAAGIYDLSDLDEWPGAQIRVEDPRAIVERTRPSVPPELLREIDYTQASFQKASGVNDYSKGIAGSTTGLQRSTETATGIQLLQNAANQSQSFKWLMAEETGVSEGLNITAANIQQVMTAPQKIRILGQNEILQNAGWKDFLIVNPQDIAGRWNFFAVGASRAKDAQSQSQLLLQATQAAESLPDVMPRLKQVEVWVAGLEASGLRNARSYLRSDEEMAQLAAQQGPQQPPHPATRLIESLNYKDLPPDVQRELEQMAGLTPSKIGGGSPVEKILADMHSRANKPQPKPAGVL